MVADLPQNDADKLKIAFAEGYMSGTGGGGSGQGEKGRAYRWLRTLQQILAIAVFTAILASLMGEHIICSLAVFFKWRSPAYVSRF